MDFIYKLVIFIYPANVHMWKVYIFPNIGNINGNITLDIGKYM